MQTGEQETKPSNVDLETQNRIVIHNKRPFDVNYQKTNFGIFLHMGAKPLKQTLVTRNSEFLLENQKFSFVKKTKR